MEDEDPGFEISNPNRALTSREVSLALKSAQGSIIAAAEALGVPTSKLSRFIHARPKFQELLKEFRKSLVDVAEAHLIEKVHEGDWKAVQLTLTTLGKDRGYTTATPAVVNINKTADPTKLSDNDLAAEVQKRIAAIKNKTQPEQLQVKVKENLTEPMQD